MREVFLKGSKRDLVFPSLGIKVRCSGSYSNQSGTITEHLTAVQLAVACFT